MNLQLSIASIAALTAATSAGVVDFANGPTWTPGTLGMYSYMDEAQADVLITDAGGVTYGSFPQAGNFFGIDSLWIAGNFASDPWGNDIVVTINFSQAVTDVSFSVTDLDGSGGNVDRVILSGALGASGPIAADANLGANIDQIDAFEFRADGTNNGQPGAAAVTADFSFDGPIDTLTLAYSSTGNSQGIIIGNVVYTIPAPSTLGALSVLGLAASRRRR